MSSSFFSRRLHALSERARGIQLEAPRATLRRLSKPVAEAEGGLRFFEPCGDRCTRRSGVATTGVPAAAPSILRAVRRRSESTGPTALSRGCERCGPRAEVADAGALGARPQERPPASPRGPAGPRTPRSRAPLRCRRSAGCRTRSRAMPGLRGCRVRGAVALPDRPVSSRSGPSRATVGAQGRLGSVRGAIGRDDGLDGDGEVPSLPCAWAVAHGLARGDGLRRQPELEDGVVDGWVPGA